MDRSKDGDGQLCGVLHQERHVSCSGVCRECGGCADDHAVASGDAFVQHAGGAAGDNVAGNDNVAPVRFAVPVTVCVPATVIVAPAGITTVLPVVTVISVPLLVSNVFTFNVLIRPSRLNQYLMLLLPPLLLLQVPLTMHYN